jgi:hypothetical protein
LDRPETFGLTGPDGTQHGYHQLYGDIAYTKYSVRVVGYGSQWDGIYTDNNSHSAGATGQSGAWYTPAATFHGKLIKYHPFDSVSGAAPDEYALLGNYPNPFNPSTTISYKVPVKSPVSLKVYDISGRFVRTLFEREITGGYHQAVWDGRDEWGRIMAAGTYIVEMESGRFSGVLKVMLLK